MVRGCNWRVFHAHCHDNQLSMFSGTHPFFSNRMKRPCALPALSHSGLRQNDTEESSTQQTFRTSQHALVDAVANNSVPSASTTRILSIASSPRFFFNGLDLLARYLLDFGHIIPSRSYRVVRGNPSYAGLFAFHPETWQRPADDCQRASFFVLTAQSVSAFGRESTSQCFV